MERHIYAGRELNGEKLAATKFQLGINLKTAAFGLANRQGVPFGKEHHMTAYLIAAETVHDEAMFADYRRQVVATVEAFGGRFIARGGKLTVLEGEWQHPRTVIIEFPGRDAAEAWYRSAAYQKIIGLRLKSTRGNLVILDGA